MIMVKRVADHIRDSILRGTGAIRPASIPDLDVLRRTEWSERFVGYMRNRLIMGVFRYRRILEQDFGRYDLPTEAKRRIDRYAHTHNLEHLVDAANMCLLAFLHGERTGETVQAIDDGEHTPESDPT